MKHELVICGIVCGEEEYLEEWLNFHILQGVGHFFLNINNPLDKTPDILKRYKDIVTLGTLPLTGDDLFNIHLWQLKAYDELCRIAKKWTEWITILDVDEFIWSPSHDKVVEALKTFKDPGIGGVVVKWLMFGSNHHRNKTDGLVIERFTRRQDGTHPHCKSLFKASHYKEQGGNCHTVRVKGLIVNEKKRPQPKEYAVDFKAGTADIVAINHYHCKSYEECMKRLSLRDGKATEVKDKEHFFSVDDYNDVEDTRLLKYADKIKLMIEERNK